MTAKLSFIVPIYNVAGWLPQCLDSLLAQPEPAMEILLVDDGSTDESLAVCREYEKKDSRIQVFHQSNQGANVARNKGLAEAEGKWVCFIDGDDWIEETFCSALDEYFSSSYDVILYSYYNVNGDVKKRAPSGSDRIEFQEKDFPELQIALLNRLGPYKYNHNCLNPVSCWNKVYRREFLMENQIRFVPEIQKLQDLTFNIQVYEHARSGLYVNKALYNYRFNPASVTNRYQPDIVHKFDVIHEFLTPFIKDKQAPIFESAYRERVATHSRTCVVLYFCNVKNKNSYSVRRKEFLRFLEKEPYATAIRNVDLKHFPIREKLLSWAIRQKQFWICELLTRLQYLWSNRGRTHSKG